MFQPSTPKKFLTIRTNDCILVFSNVACWGKKPENRQIFTINTINMATHRITIYIHADLERDSDSMWFHTTQSEYIHTAQTCPYHNNIHQLVSLHIMHILVFCDSEFPAQKVKCLSPLYYLDTASYFITSPFAT